MLISHKCIINIIVKFNITRLSTYFHCLINETDYQQRYLKGTYSR